MGRGDRRILAEVWAEAPTAPGEVEDWPGGWLLRAGRWREPEGPGILGAWRTREEAATEASEKRDPENWEPVWVPIVQSTHGEIGHILDDTFWSSR